MAKLSQSPILTVIATFFATMSLGFGINSIRNPMSELSMFELQDLAVTADPVLIDCLSKSFSVFPPRIAGFFVCAFVQQYGIDYS